jgi:hypothetical protein
MTLLHSIAANFELALCREAIREGQQVAGQGDDAVARMLAQSLAAGTVIHAKDYSIFVVRRSGGGGGEFLRLRVQEFESHEGGTVASA